MDHLLDIKQLVQSLLQDFSGFPNDDYPHLKDKLIVDEAQQHFIVFTYGWKGNNYVHFTNFHIEVKPDHTIWIHDNKTDIPIEVHLMERGVAKEQLKIARLMQPAMAEKSF